MRKVEMPENTFVKTTPCVRVELGGPGDFVHAFLTWCLDENIYTIPGTGGRSGLGKHSGYYTAEDAERIREWVEAQEAQ